MMTSQPGQAARSPFRLAVLGGGAVAASFYVPALVLVPEVQIVLIPDAMPSVEAALRQAGFKGHFRAASFVDILADLSPADVDGVVIGLPNALHDQASVTALHRGFPVLVEKPLAMTRTGCLRVAA